VAVVVSTPQESWFLYLIRCGDGSLYTGITTDVSRRLEEHRNGGLRAARYLRGRGPLELVYSSEVGDRSSASAAENRIKRMPVQFKQALVNSQMPLDQWLLQIQEK